MRVSTAQIFDAGTFGIQSNQASLFKIQNQLSTGRRILTPADDPIGASQALVVDQSKSMNSQFMANQGNVKTQLGQVDTNLNSVTNELQSILERAVQAGNGTLGAAERNMIGTELQSRLDNLVSLANEQDGTGHYLYSGFQTQVKPFSVTGNVGTGVPPAFDLTNQHVSYAGDNGLRQLQVSSSVTMSMNVPGSDVFMQVRDAAGNVTNRSVFDSVKNLINNLQQASFNTPAFSNSLAELHSALDNVSQVRADVGARLNALDGLDSSSQDLKLQYDSRLSELQDVDYAKAISDLSRQQLQLEAAQKSFAQTSQLSLFSVL